MMSKLVPKLRFKEFSGEWEEKEIKNIFSIFQGYAFSSKSSSTNGIRWLKIADVGIQNMKNDNQSFLPITYATTYKQFIVKQGDYVIALTRPILNNKLKIAPINSTFNGALLNQRVGKLVTNENIEFIYFLLQTKLMIKKIEQSISGTEPPNLSAQKLENIKIFIPKVKEQQKIANTLSSLDNLIEATSKKVEALKKHKKGLMQKLFPKEGKKEPEIRFGEFFGEWKEKKLKDIVKIFKGKGISKNNIDENGNIECIRYGELYTDYREVIKQVKSKTNLKKETLILSKKNDVIIPSSGETNIDIATAHCILKDNVALGGDLNILRGLENGIFLAYYLSNAKKYDIAKLAQGIAVVHLYASQLEKLNLQLPTPKEQKKIADTLSSLDNLIEATSKKVEALKKHKKGLMQQMFVSGEE